ncbi:v-type proton ATPase 16 kDa proteolipid subunit 2 [Lecanora helva]
MSETSEKSPDFAPFFGMGGIAFAMIFGCMGAAYGTAKSGIGIAGVGTFRPDLIMKVKRLPLTITALMLKSSLQSLIPVVMAGIIAVYSLVIAVLIAGDMEPPPKQHYSLFNGFMHLAAGLSVGLTGLAAGYAIGIVGDVVRWDEASIRRTRDLIDYREFDHICNNQEFSSAWF